MSYFIQINLNLVSHPTQPRQMTAAEEEAWRARVVPSGNPDVMKQFIEPSPYQPQLIHRGVPLPNQFYPPTYGFYP
jgi:hypothetical protein